MALASATIFDCRELPVPLVRDTGYAAFEDFAQTGEAVRLPHPICYWEFADSPDILLRALLAEEIQVPETQRFTLPPDHSGTIVRVWYYVNWDTIDRADPETLNLIERAIKSGLITPDDLGVPMFVPYAGEFNNRVYDAPAAFFTERLIFPLKQGIDHPIEESERELAHEGGVALLGLVALLQDKLLLEQFVPDPQVWWQRERAKKGKLPTSGDAHVLTVNVPAVRYAVSRSAAPRGTHESPCLHWRRGHSRTLHRGSEFESTTWVRRCLVGDPDKGFIAPSYRLTSRLPMPGEVIH
jgi:hypothetical protein